VRFIGELYKLNMLSPPIMVACVNALLTAPSDEKLECLSILLTVIGQKLDYHIHEQEFLNMISPRMRTSKNWVPKPGFMDNTFEKILELSVKESVSPRIRFKLQVST